MRDATMQWLTWGTIAGSAASAMWLSTIGGEAEAGALTALIGVELLLPVDPAPDGSVPDRHDAPAPAASAGSGSLPGR